MITVACVRAGKKYGINYVEKLRNMVNRHLKVDHEIICLTDQPDSIPGVTFIQCSFSDLNGWWAKLLLFDPAIRGSNHCIYFDLDTVIVGDITPLSVPLKTFQICQNFTRLSGNKSYPCDFGSCVMVFPEGWGRFVWEAFYRDRKHLMQKCRYGDQQAIELIIRDAQEPVLYLQDMLPPGFFVGRRDFTNEKPKGAAVMVFAGNHKPHNTPHRWLKDAWK